MKTMLSAALMAVMSVGIHAAEVDESAIKTPQQALEALKEGNERFVSGKVLKQDFHAQILKTKDGQAPYAAVISCLDSRVAPEILFDQGIGDIFVGRVAGNIEDINLIGSAEFATQLVGTKLLVVLGHTSCGAVKGACANAKLGSLTHLLDEIRPAVRTVQAAHPGEDVCKAPLIDEAAVENVRKTIVDIREKSPVMAELEKEGKLMIVGAMYDISSGRVTFL